MYVYMHLSTGVSCQSPGDRVMADYEPLYVGTGTEHGFSGRGVYCLHH